MKTFTLRLMIGDDGLFWFVNDELVPFVPADRIREWRFTYEPPLLEFVERVRNLAAIHVTEWADNPENKAMVEEDPEALIKVARLYVSSGIFSTCLRQWNAVDEYGRMLPLSQENQQRLLGTVLFEAVDRMIAGADESRYPSPQLMAL